MFLAASTLDKEIALFLSFSLFFATTGSDTLPTRIQVLSWGGVGVHNQSCFASSPDLELKSEEIFDFLIFF